MNYTVTLKGEFFIQSPGSETSLAFDVFKIVDLNAVSDDEALLLAKEMETEFVQFDPSWFVSDPEDDFGVVEAEAYPHGAGIYDVGVVIIHVGDLDGDLLMESSGCGDWMVYRQAVA